MNARILTTATLAFGFSIVLPAKAADPQLLNLVMPDAKILAGVNVDQAKTSQFGQYVLNQMQSNDRDMLKLTAETGFDPTRDVHELLVASTAEPGAKESGLFLARGTFDPAKIAAAAASHGAVSETYKGVTILEDPKSTHGVAFLSSSIVVAGDLANVKGAIDRQALAQPLPASIVVEVNQWSNSQDAWGISAVPPSTLQPSAKAPKVPGIGANAQGTFQAVQSAAGGVKFGSLVVVTAEAVADTAQNAQSMGDALKLLASLAQMQASKDPAAATLLQSLKVSSQGTTLNVSVSMPEDQLQLLLKPKAATPRKATAPAGGFHKM